MNNLDNKKSVSLLVEMRFNELLIENHREDVRRILIAAIDSFIFRDPDILELVLMDMAMNAARHPKMDVIDEWVMEREYDRLFMLSLQASTIAEDMYDKNRVLFLGLLDHTVRDIVGVDEDNVVIILDSGEF